MPSRKCRYSNEIELLLLLVGGDKDSQQADIDQALQMVREIEIEEMSK